MLSQIPPPHCIEVDTISEPSVVLKMINKNT